MLEYNLAECFLTVKCLVQAYVGYGYWTVEDRRFKDHSRFRER